MDEETDAFAGYPALPEGVKKRRERQLAPLRKGGGEERVRVSREPRLETGAPVRLGFVAGWVSAASVPNIR